LRLLGVNYNQISTILGISISAAHEHHRAAIIKLRELVANLVICRVFSINLKKMREMYSKVCEYIGYIVRGAHEQLINIVMSQT